MQKFELEKSRMTPKNDGKNDALIINMYMGEGANHAVSTALVRSAPMTEGRS